MELSTIDKTLIKRICLPNFIYHINRPDIQKKTWYKTVDQFTGERKTGIQNDILISETKERSKRLKSTDSQNLKGLTKYLSEIKGTKMKEEYKVC